MLHRLDPGHRARRHRPRADQADSPRRLRPSRCRHSDRDRDPAGEFDRRSIRAAFALSLCGTTIPIRATAYLGRGCLRSTGMGSVNKVHMALLSRMLVLGPLDESCRRIRDVVISISIVHQQPRILGLAANWATSRSIFILILRVAAMIPTFPHAVVNGVRSPTRPQPHLTGCLPRLRTPLTAAPQSGSQASPWNYQHSTTYTYADTGDFLGPGDPVPGRLRPVTRAGARQPKSPFGRGERGPTCSTIFCLTIGAWMCQSSQRTESTGAPGGILMRKSPRYDAYHTNIAQVATELGRRDRPSTSPSQSRVSLAPAAICCCTQSWCCCGSH
uniref:U1756u n=1 Tax=Mycobacterium leprae TaxID=1769 RepID=Q49974_MYCLR|nr:u1756u [Mycobacterium leprae]